MCPGTVSKLMTEKRGKYSFGDDFSLLYVRLASERCFVNTIIRHIPKPELYVPDFLF